MDIPESDKILLWNHHIEYSRDDSGEYALCIECNSDFHLCECAKKSYFDNVPYQDFTWLSHFKVATRLGGIQSRLGSDTSAFNGTCLESNTSPKEIKSLEIKSSDDEITKLDDKITDTNELINILNERISSMELKYNKQMDEMRLEYTEKINKFYSILMKM